MLDSFHQLRMWLECETLDDLVTYILDRELYTFVRSSFISQDLQLLTFFAESYCPTTKPIYTCNPPNHLVSIFNWELVAVLLSRVGTQKQQIFLEHCQQMTYEGANIVNPEPALQSEEPLMFIDSHFHLDQILRRMRLRNFSHLQSVVAPSCAQGFYYGIANGVFPSCCNNWQGDIGYARGVYVSFGIHPHIAAKGITKRQFAHIDSLTDIPLCVAVGEIGLDFTTTCSCRPCIHPEQCRETATQYQEETLLHMLYLADRKGLPVILHCRDSEGGSAACRTLQLILSNDLGRLKLYRHCFDGNLAELQA